MSVSGGNASPSHCCAPAVCQAEAKTLFTPEGSHSFPLSSLVVTEIYIYIYAYVLCVCGGGRGVGMGGSIYYPNFPTSFAAKGLNAMTKSCG